MTESVFDSFEKQPEKWHGLRPGERVDVILTGEKKEVALEPMPRIQLTNGLCVANFSSPHSFEFSDGSVLPGCSEERALTLILVPLEESKPSPCGRWTDIDLEFTLPVVTKAVMLTSVQEEVDVILVPLPMLLCIKEYEWFGDDNVRGKIRCIRMTDRISKRIHIDRFCI